MERDIAKEVAEYAARMKGNYFFRVFGLTPKWVPGAEDIEGFIHDEVVRQGHNPRVADDGLYRILGMRAAWGFATMAAKERRPTHDDILRLGNYIEPEQNSPHQWRQEDVYIGNHTGCPPAMLNIVLPMLCHVLPDVVAEQGRGNDAKHPYEIRNIWAYGIRPQAEMLSMLAECFKSIETADDWYLAFEAVHPFRDGNGRTGKVLHNWLLGTLNNPVLVSDYFKGGNP